MHSSVTRCFHIYSQTLKVWRFGRCLGAAVSLPSCDILPVLSSTAAVVKHSFGSQLLWSSDEVCYGCVIILSTVV